MENHVTVMTEQAVLLARFHHPATPSQGTLIYPSDILCRTPPYSGGTAPAYTGFPIKSVGHLFPKIFKSNANINTNYLICQENL